MNNIINIIQSNVFLLWITVFICLYVSNFLLGIYLGQKYEGFCWSKFLDGLIKGIILVIAIGLLLFSGILVDEINLEGLGKISIIVTIVALFTAGAGMYGLKALQKLAFIIGVKLPEKFQLAYEPIIREESMVDGHGEEDGDGGEHTI